MAAFKQGKYTPKHPEKYIGDVTKIRYMSGWELSTHTFLDNNPNILRWSSEGFSIPYMKPTDHRIHKYFPDYYIEYKSPTTGQLVREILEVKPLAQTKRPRQRKTQTTQSKLYEQMTYAVNMAKWEAAEAFCKKHNLIFRKVTEKQIFR
jgi:hypothetical protein